MNLSRRHILVLGFGFLILAAAFLIGVTSPASVSADIHDDCPGCGDIFCTAPCGQCTNLCACERQLCDYYLVCNGTKDWCEDEYNNYPAGLCCTKFLCGGIGICQGTCPYPPCCSICDPPPGGGTATPTPTPIICNCGSWSNVSCGIGGCLASEMQQTRTCNPAGCLPESQCVPDASCGCTCDATWTDAGCGLGGCAADQMNQTRTCNPAGCSSESRCIESTSCGSYSCDISIPDVSLTPDETVTITVTINSEAPVGAFIDYVTFVSTNPVVASVTPSDFDPAFRTTITGLSVDTTTYTATAVMNDGVTTCSAQGTITVTNSGAWWQVIGGDLMAGKTGTGSIRSTVPASCVMPACNPVLIISNLGGYPGVPSAGSSISPASNVSSTNWQALGASYSSIENQDYAFFEKKAQNATLTNLTDSDISGAGELTAGVLYKGYYWVKYDGNSHAGSDLTISATLNLGTNKVVLFVKNADLLINAPIELTDGRGAFIVIADEDILVDDTVGGPQEQLTCIAGGCTPDIKGIFFADGQFKTGTRGPDANGDPQDLQLHVKGSISGLGISAGVPGTNDGLFLQRSLRNNSRTPAELFEFAPDQYFLFPQILSPKNILWREVAP